MDPVRQVPLTDDELEMIVYALETAGMPKRPGEFGDADESPYNEREHGGLFTALAHRLATFAADQLELPDPTKKEATNGP